MIISALLYMPITLTHILNTLEKAYSVSSVVPLIDQKKFKK